MGHPEFFEHMFVISSSGLRSGIAKGGQPLAGVWGVPKKLSFFFSRRLLRRIKEVKRVFGDTPNPGRDAALPAPSFCELLFQKFGMTHGGRATAGGENT